MAEFKRTVGVVYRPEQMYDLVDAIEYYPEFLPWCERARIDRRDERHVDATLGFKQVGFRGDFTTRNTLAPKHRIEMELLDGPFDQLKGWWGFEETDTGSDVSFYLSYRFENPLAGFMFATVVETIASELVTAFADRADIVYQADD